MSATAHLAIGMGVLLAIAAAPRADGPARPRRVLLGRAGRGTRPARAAARGHCGPPGAADSGLADRGRQAPARAGGRDVLIGVDGSARAAARAVTGLVVARRGGLTLVWVLDFDTAETGMQWGGRERATRELDQEADELKVVFEAGAETVVLAAPPAQVLATQGRDGHLKLVAVGSRGRGASTAVLAGVAGNRARHTSVPVLVVSAVQTTPAAHVEHTAQAGR